MHGAAGLDRSNRGNWQAKDQHAAAMREIESMKGAAEKSKNKSKQLNQQMEESYVKNSSRLPTVMINISRGCKLEKVEEATAGIQKKLEAKTTECKILEGKLESMESAKLAEIENKSTEQAMYACLLYTSPSPRD